MKEKPSPQPKPILVKKSIKHIFDNDEMVALHVDFGTAFDNLGAAEAEFENIKAVHKAKIQEAESKMITLRATINAGFEYRDTELVVVFRPECKKKDYYVWDPETQGTTQEPVLTEDMTPDDFQRDLIQAESIFDLRKELTIWQAGGDLGVLIVGRLGSKWYSALRCNVGACKLEERLDSEQKAYKTREAAVNTALTRCLDWLECNLGKETAKTFSEVIKNVASAETGKVE